MNDTELAVTWKDDCIFRILLERCHLQCGCLITLIENTKSDISKTALDTLLLMRSPKIHKRLDTIEFWLENNLLKESGNKFRYLQDNK